MRNRLRLLMISAVLTLTLVLTGASGWADILLPTVSVGGTTLTAGASDSPTLVRLSKKSKKKKNKNKNKNKNNDSQTGVQTGSQSAGSGSGSLNGSQSASLAAADAAGSEAGLTVDEDGFYTTKDEVALYIHLYGKLPGNYISKREAEDLGWNASRGNLWDVAPGKSIGGSRFGNYEGLLPEARNRKYTECDIDYDGGYRNSKRIIFSNDGLIFYTEDHYRTFEQLY